MVMQTVIHIHIFSDILVLQASQFLDVNQYEKKECMGRFFFANETFEIMYVGVGEPCKTCAPFMKVMPWVSF